MPSSRAIVSLSAPMLVALLCSGCGGGGGGGGGGSSPPPVSEYLAPGTNTSLRTLSAQETFSALSVTGSDDGTADPVVTTAIESTTTTVTLRPSTANPNGDFQVTINTNNLAQGVNNYSRTFDTRIGQTGTGIDQSDPWTTTRIFGIPNVTSPTAQLVMTDPAASANPRPNLSYQSYGYWQDGFATTIAPAVGGIFSYGIITSPSQIPATGVVNYAGTMIGSVVTNGNTTNPSVQFLDATVNVLVNFANQSMVLDSTSSRVSTNGVSWVSQPQWNVTGTLTWNAGTNRFDGSVSGTGGTAHSGPAAGRFYGPNAQELGGVLNTADSGGTFGIQGAAFGAVRP